MMASRLLRRVLPLLLAVTGLSPNLFSREADEEGEGTHARGLVVTFVVSPRKTGDGSPRRDARLARLVALHLSPDRAATPFLPDGPFEAVWEGFLRVEFDDLYAFSVSGRGRVTVELGGQKTIAASGDDLSRTKEVEIALEQGDTPLRVHYVSPSSGNAELRLHWSSFDFSREPVPPHVLFHDRGHPGLRRGRLLREGRRLLATYRCLGCHTPPPALPAAIPSGKGMPELSMDAPSLEGIGSRLRADWMARWIDDPRRLRPSARMPRMHLGDGLNSTPAARQRAARAIAAFLATLKNREVSESKAPNATLRPRGARLFLDLGCISCHEVPGENGAGEAEMSPEEKDRISLTHLKAKWRPEALKGFLLQPERHYAWIRMPNFGLGDGEADALAAFLFSLPQEKVEPLGESVADPERGRTLVRENGCLGCHSLELENLARPPALKIPGGNWKRGCVADSSEDRGRAPDFGFTPLERSALRVFAASDWHSLGKVIPEEFLERQIRDLRCTACHVRDGQTDVWSAIAARNPDLESLLQAEPEPKATPPENAGAPEEYTLIQSRPRLTWVGEMLRPDWLRRFLAGEIDYKPRDWIRSRMPAFPTRARLLAEGFQLQHGFAPDEPALPKPRADMLPVGKRLVSRDAFSCLSCHDLGAQPATSVFEAKGVNFVYIAERIRKSYFDRWMTDPARILPETKMPRFTDDEGMSSLADIYEGNARKQFEAIWNYLLQGRGIVPPD